MSFPPSADTPFGITHPLGLPRPVDISNLFGANILYFALNVMPIPTGCLSPFDGGVYRPYAKRLVTLLGRREFGWSGPVAVEDPPRYCLLRDGVPAEIPSDLHSDLPAPPHVSLNAILAYFSCRHTTAAPLQLLDLLTLVSEDLGPAKFAAATEEHPWVQDFLR